jgi:hypothetical protein
MIKRLLFYFFATRRDKLIAKADKWHKIDGKQYFVMPTKRINDKNYDKGLILVHGKTFLDEFNRKAKKIGKISMSYMDMCNQCVYKTSPGTTLKR